MNYHQFLLPIVFFAIFVGVESADGDTVGIDNGARGGGGYWRRSFTFAIFTDVICSFL